MYRCKGIISPYPTCALVEDCISCMHTGSLSHSVSSLTMSSRCCLHSQGPDRACLGPAQMTARDPGYPAWTYKVLLCSYSRSSFSCLRFFTFVCLVCYCLALEALSLSSVCVFILIDIFFDLSCLLHNFGQSFTTLLNNFTVDSHYRNRYKQTPLAGYLSTHTIQPSTGRQLWQDHPSCVSSWSSSTRHADASTTNTRSTGAPRMVDRGMVFRGGQC
ncbi:hypothetical protein V8F33_005313 [Rhypophila sp. PSN 637]